jgi:hypothetical protein
MATAMAGSRNMVLQFEKGFRTSKHRDIIKKGWSGYPLKFTYAVDMFQGEEMVS